MTPKKRQRNLQLDKSFRIGLTVPYSFNIHIPLASYKTIDERNEFIHNEKQKQIDRHINKIKLKSYREFISFFKQLKLNYYWCHIKIIFSDEVSSIHHLTYLMDVGYNFHFVVTFKFSQHDLNRLKLVHQDFYELLIDDSRDAIKFQDMFGYLIKN